MTVTVTPDEFKFVFFDAAAIVSIAEKLVGEVGLERDVVIEIDESTPLGRSRVSSLDPVTLAVEGGAFEDAKRPRKLSETGVSDVVGKWLFHVRDRLDPAFGTAPDDDDLSLAETAAWDTYCIGRLARLGYAVQRQRRLYHFRNRHGFSDLADEAFEQLWTADGLSWADIKAICDRTEQASTPVA